MLKLLQTIETFELRFDHRIFMKQRYCFLFFTVGWGVGGWEWGRGGVEACGRARGSKIFLGLFKG